MLGQPAERGVGQPIKRLLPCCLHGAAGTSVKLWYQRYLLPYERHLRTTGAWNSSAEGAAAATQQQQQQQAGPGEAAAMGPAGPLDVATLEQALAVAMARSPGGAAPAPS